MQPLVEQPVVVDLKPLLEAIQESQGEYISVFTFGQKSQDLALWQRLVNATFFCGGEFA